jgi:sialic acid synthase SpsE
MALLINGVPLDDPRRVYIIAEASGNHSQDFKKAIDLTRAAAECGADAIKWQTFTAEEICADIPFPFGHDEAHDAWARSLGVERMRDLFRLGGLPREWHVDLKAEAEKCGIAFLSTPFSVDAAKFLVEQIGVQAIKIASGDLTFQPLIDYVTPLDIPVIMSTGGANMYEILDLVRTNVRLKTHLILMCCTSVYPCNLDMANLLSIRTMKYEHGLRVGYSDHTLSTDLVPSMAIACGALCYEKHIRLEHDHDSVDAAHSLAPSQFARMVEVIRSAPSILGSGIKKPHPKELHDRKWARRSTIDWLRPTEAARRGEWD